MQPHHSNELQLFADALDRLDEALRVMGDYPALTVVRDGAIKRFEFTYEMAIRCLRARLRQGAHPDAGRYGYRTTIRFSADVGLIDDPQAWIDYTNSRQNTAHGYNEPVTISVAADVPRFAADARRLLNRQPIVNGIGDGFMTAASDQVCDGVIIRPRWLAMVREILQRHAPHREVRAFGSRVVGGNRPFSDLDLAIGGDAPVDGATLVGLRDALEESDLPINVDVVPLQTAGPHVVDAVARHSVVIQVGTEAA